MTFLKQGFDVFVLASFEDKTDCRILDLLEFVKKMFGEPDRRELQYSSFDKTKAQRRGFVASIVRL